MFFLNIYYIIFIFFFKIKIHLKGGTQNIGKQKKTEEKIKKKKQGKKT